MQRILIIAGSLNLRYSARLGSKASKSPTQTPDLTRFKTHPELTLDPKILTKPYECKTSSGTPSCGL